MKMRIFNYEIANYNLEIQFRCNSLRGAVTPHSAIEGDRHVQAEAVGRSRGISTAACSYEKRCSRNEQQCGHGDPICVAGFGE